MQYLVIERWRNGIELVKERFESSGRMLPEGLHYVSSWMDANGERCFQLMDTEDPSALNVWCARWSDLVEFEIVEVIDSASLWAQYSTTTDEMNIDSISTDSRG